MNNDGDLDPSGYTRVQLVLALGRTNREKYPRNFTILSQELASRRADEERESAKQTVRQPWAQESARAKQVLMAAMFCGAVMLGFVLVVGVTGMFIRLPPSPWPFLSVLVVAIHIAAFQYSRRVEQRLAGDRLLWLVVGCAMPFCLFDIGLPKLFSATGITPREPEQHWTDTIFLPAFADVLIVVAVVYLTVPFAQRMCDRAKAD